MAATGARVKKKLSCGPTDRARHERGRAVYNGHCYFCHGYSGNAETQAAHVLNPPPRDFTAAQNLSFDRIVESIRDGRPGTAMRAFQTILSPAEIEAVGAFVLDEFAHCRLENTRYHTPENGWPDHPQRYGAAYAFVSGADSSVAPSDEGRRLYQEACITCHENSAERGLHPLQLEARNHGASPAEASHDHDEEYYPEGDDDGAPPLANLSPAERLGLEIYGRACAQCHGHDGTGRNSVALFLEPHPSDLTADSLARRMKDDNLRRTVVDGLVETSMPAFGAVLSPGEIDGLIAYVKRAFFGSPLHTGDP